MVRLLYVACCLVLVVAGRVLERATALHQECLAMEADEAERKEQAARNERKAKALAELAEISA